MSANATQRPVTFAGRFDIKRIADIQKLKKGKEAGRFVEIYDASTNVMDHSIDAGDLLFQMRDGQGFMNERYMDAERNRTMVSQQPAVSVNLRGSSIENEDFQKNYGSDLIDEGARKQQAMRDQIVVLGAAKYNCLYDPTTLEQKDPAIMSNGTIDSVAQHSIKAGDSLMWDVPRPGTVQRVGKRDIKELNKLRVEIIPIRDNARCTLESLIEWCDLSNCTAAKTHWRNGNMQAWMDEMRTYVLDGANQFWTKEGQFLMNLAKSYLDFVNSGLTFPAGVDMDGFKYWATLIFNGKQYTQTSNVEAREVYFTAVNGMLFAQVSALLDCNGRSVGRCTRSAEAGGYFDWIVDVL